MIYAVVLATGQGNERSRALDTDGQGRRFIERIRATAVAAGIERVIVVVGPPDGEAVRKVMSPGVAWVANPRPDRGPMSSVQVALTSLPPTARAALLWPVDFALVEPSTIQALLAASAGAANGKLIVPTFEGVVGRPLRLPRALFGEISVMPADTSLDLLVSRRADAVQVEVTDAAVLGDQPRKAKPLAVAVSPGAEVSAASPSSAPPARPRSPRPRPAKAR